MKVKNQQPHRDMVIKARVRADRPFWVIISRPTANVCMNGTDLRIKDGEGQTCGAQQWARDGMPFLRDPGGRPMAMKSQIDEYIFELNQLKHDHKIWKDEGIDTALGYEAEKEKARKDFDERFIWAQRPPRSRF